MRSKATIGGRIAQQSRLERKDATQVVVRGCEGSAVKKNVLGVRKGGQVSLTWGESKRLSKKKTTTRREKIRGVYRQLTSARQSTIVVGARGWLGVRVGLWWK